MSYILGVDSSSYEPSAAVVSDGLVCAQEYSKDSFVGAEALLKLVDGVCRSAQTVLSGLGGIAVVVGPGSFTGIRSSISTAQGLNFGSGVPVRGISLFDAAAHFIGCQSEASRRMVLTVRANKAELFCAIYEQSAYSGLVEMMPCTAICEEFMEETIEQALKGQGELPVARYDLRDASWRTMSKGPNDYLVISNAALAAMATARHFEARFLNANSPAPEAWNCQQLRPLYGKGVQAKTIAERNSAKIG